MLSQKEDTANYFGTLFFLVLIFVLFGLFPTRSVTPIALSPKYQTTSELNLQFTKAVVADAIQIPSVQNSCLFLLRNFNINLFSETCKILADNSTIAQRIIVLNEIKLLIKPLLPLCFCIRFLPPDTAESKILS